MLHGVVAICVGKEEVILNICTESVLIELKFNVRSKKSNWETAAQVPDILKKYSVQIEVFVYLIFSPPSLKKF